MGGSINGMETWGGEAILRAIAKDSEEDLLAALELEGVDIKEGLVESDIEDRETSDWFVTFGGAKITYKQIGKRYDDMELVDGDTPMEVANRNKKFATNKILHAKKKELNAAAAAAAE